MSTNQENSGEGRNTLPLKDSATEEVGTSTSVLAASMMGFDNLGDAGAGAPCGQYPMGGAVPNVAPAAPQPEGWANIPQQLRERLQWCVAGNDKAPRIASENLPSASSTDPSTWRTFDEARAFATHHSLHIGYMLHESDPFTCIDLDVKDDTPPEKIERFHALIKAFDSYTEYSQSGKGFHIWVRGKVGNGCRRDGVEIYSQERFIICTGNVLHNKPVENRQELLDILVAEIREASQSTIIPLVEVDETESDEKIWERAANAENGEKFKNLCLGNWQALHYPSQSEADLSLLSMLTFYTKSNEQVRRMFRATKLGEREKAQKNNRYLDRTLGTIRGRMAREEAAQESLQANSVQLIQKVSERALLSIETPSTLDWPPGFAGKLAQFIYNSSYLPVREVAITATLALLAGVCGRAFTISGKSTTLYIILVARSGIGKDGMHEAIHTLIKMSGVPMAERFINASDFASGPALHKALLRQPGFLNLQGEFGRKLKRMVNTRDTPMQDLRTVMTDAFAKNFLDGKTYSDSEKTMLGVARPALSFLGETTPGTFYEALTPDMMADGFMSRFLVITYDGARPLPNEARAFELDTEEMERWRAIIRQAIPYQQVINAPPPIEVNYSDDAIKKLQLFELKCGEAVNASGNDESQRQMWNRAHLKALQISALLAIADNEASPKIDLGHATWAITTVRSDIAVFSAKINSGDIGSDDQSRETKLLSLMMKYIKEEPAQSYNISPDMRSQGVIPRRYFQRNVSSATTFINHKMGATAALDSAIRSLIDSGYLIEMPKNKIPLEWGAQGKCFHIGRLTK